MKALPTPPVMPLPMSRTVKAKYSSDFSFSTGLAELRSRVSMRPVKRVVVKPKPQAFTSILPSTGPDGVDMPVVLLVMRRWPSRTQVVFGISVVPCRYWKWAASTWFSAISWLQVLTVQWRVRMGVKAGSPTSGMVGCSQRGSRPARSCQTMIIPLTSLTVQARMSPRFGIFLA